MSDSIQLPPLTMGRYQFELTLNEAAELPPYLGAVLRGGFGVMFKRLVCMQPHLKRCSDCVLLHTCAYPTVFEPTPPPEAQVLRTHERIPVPYVFDPPPQRETAWGAGETLCFKLGLFGQGITYLPYFILAFQELGRRGLGLKRKRARLSQVLTVEANGYAPASLWEANTLRRDWATYGQWSAQAMVGEAARPDTPSPEAPSRLTLYFQTPTRLKFDDHILRTAPPFHVVIRNLLRRVSSLSYFYAGQQWQTDYRGWIEQATQIEMTANEARWMDWERYSTRQRQRMNLGGIVGRVTYQGDLTPFLPLLRLGELAHLGKGAVFGNGQYQLTP